MNAAETILYTIAEYAKLGVECLSILTVTWGILYSFYHYGIHLFSKDSHGYGALRLSLARYLIVALEFQLAADILGTAIAPDWDEIGQLAAIAVIRNRPELLPGERGESRNWRRWTRRRGGILSRLRGRLDRWIRYRQRVFARKLSACRCM